MNFSGGSKKISSIISRLVGPEESPQFVILPLSRKCFLGQISFCSHAFFGSSATVKHSEIIFFEHDLNLFSPGEFTGGGGKWQ